MAPTKPPSGPRPKKITNPKRASAASASSEHNDHALDTDLALPPDHDADDDADDGGSAEGNVIRAKRDLIKLGLQQGHLTSEQIQAALPISYMSDSEIETLFFTLATMGIQTPRDTSK